MIKRFLLVVVSGGILLGSAWLTAGPAAAAEDPPVNDDPQSGCMVCW